MAALLMECRPTFHPADRLWRKLPKVNDRFARMAWVLAALRILMGVLWLANLSWKLPPDFGRDQPRGLLFAFGLGLGLAPVALTL